MNYKGFTICYCKITRQWLIKLDWLTDYFVSSEKEAKRIIDRLVERRTKKAA